VYFIGGADFENAVRRTGADYVRNNWDFTRPELAEGQFSVPEGFERLIWHNKHFFLDCTPDAFYLMKDLLRDVRKKHPKSPVVILHETMFGGILPFYYGAPLPEGYDQLPKVINFHTSVNIMTSRDVFPVGSGTPPPSNEEQRAELKALLDARGSYHKVLNDYADRVFKPLGATKGMTGWYWDTLLEAHDITLLPYSPSLDYPRSDLSPKIQFIGGLPLKPVDPDFKVPPWWDDIQANAALSFPEKKKLVFVTQGTTNIDYNDLLIPSIEALASRSDIIAIATLGSRGASLPRNVGVPPNTRVVDYFPYDALLPLVDVFVSNAGLGGLMHGIMNGVPMVVAGVEADKAEVSARAEWSGMAVNLRSGRPSVSALAEGINKVLRDAAYKKRAVELKRENEAMNALGTVEKLILSYSQ
jgi:UDP:flavonoid glycosyltransferase YjiC (YdhE family)